MATIRTGASAYLKYGFEAAYAGSATIDKKFGLQDKLSSWSLTHNRIDLPALNQVEIGTYAYGQQSGSLSVGFVLSNPWIFKSIYGSPSTAGGSDPYTHTFPHASTGQPKSMVGNTLQVEIGLDGSDQDIVRTLKGCVVNTLGISASIGETVSATCDMTYGSESEPSTTLGTAPTQPDVEFPYTFAHGTLKIGGATIAEVQDVDITFGQNPDLLYAIGSNQAVDSYRRVFDITGRFRAALLNKNRLENVLAQIAKNSGTAYEETVGGSPELELKFVRDSGEEINITGTGLAPTDLAISGVEPVEPIFEEINWRVKSCVITAKNDQSTQE